MLYITHTPFLTVKQDLQPGKQLQQFLLCQAEFRTSRPPIGDTLPGKGLVIDKTTGFECRQQGWNKTPIEKITHGNDIKCPWPRRIGLDIPHLGPNGQRPLERHLLQRGNSNIGNIPGIYLQTLLCQQDGIAP